MVGQGPTIPSTISIDSEFVLDGRARRPADPIVLDLLGDAKGTRYYQGRGLFEGYFIHGTSTEEIERHFKEMVSFFWEDGSMTDPADQSPEMKEFQAGMDNLFYPGLHDN